jgi:hypothetical protein
MANVSTLARKFIIEVDTDGAPNWVQLVGVTDFTPKTERTKQDADTYDSNGWGGREVTMNRWGAEVTFLRQADEVTGDYPVAQETLRAASTGFGSAARAHVRWYDREGGPEAYEGTAIVDWERANSGVTDLDAAKVTLDAAAGAEELQTIANPLA